MTAIMNTVQRVEIYRVFTYDGSSSIEMGVIVLSPSDPDTPNLTQDVSYYAENRHRRGSGPWFAAHGCRRAPNSFMSSDVGSLQMAGLQSILYQFKNKNSWTKYYLYSTGSDFYKIKWSRTSFSQINMNVTKVEKETWVSSGPVGMIYVDRKTRYKQQYVRDTRDWTDGEIITFSVDVARNAPYLGNASFAEAHWVDTNWPQGRNRDSFDYRHNELSSYLMFKETGIWPNLYASGFAMAYVNAIEDLPIISMNNVENAFQIIGSITSLCMSIMRRNLGSSLESLKDVRNVWLAWRYSYCTTKSDASELVSLAKRLDEVTDRYSTITARGVYRQQDMLFRVTLKAIAKDLRPKGFKEAITSVGLNLNGSNLWDLIPFSFMVDWFAHVGDWLSWHETVNNTSLKFAIKEQWNSCRTVYDDQCVYFRVSGVGTQTGVMPPLVAHTPSDKTLWFRLTDMLTIFSQ